MIRPLLGCAAALAACSAEPQHDATVAANAQAGSESAAKAAVPVTPVAAAPLDAHARPQPATLRTFGDWTVGCDNTRRCELRSLLPDAGGPAGVTVAIAREAGSDGRISLAAGTDDAEATSIAVEGAAAARTPAALVAAMANGRRMIARVAGGALPVSLTGASAALRYADAAQGRAGTTTALVARGSRPAGTVPPAAAAPVIVAVTPAGRVAKATPAQLAAMRKAAACDDGTADAPELHALGGGRTLVLLPCSAGAYNLLQSLFVLDGAGFAAARSDAPVGFAETDAPGPSVPAVVNGAWKDGVLTSYAKGRGLGDCGVAQDLVWDGGRFRLSRQREMGECRGNADYITTWQARVVWR